MKTYSVPVGTVNCIVCRQRFTDAHTLIVHQDLVHECDLCYAADDYEWGQHTGIEAVWLTQDLNYEDGTTAPFTDLMRLCICCRQTLPIDGDVTIVPVMRG